MEKKMNKILKLASTILILTTGLGVATTVNSSTNYLVSHESHNRVGHSHKKIEIPPEKPVPGVDLLVYKDTMKGWNLELKTTNFKFESLELFELSFSSKSNFIVDALFSYFSFDLITIFTLWG